MTNKLQFLTLLLIVINIQQVFAQWSLANFPSDKALSSVIIVDGYFFVGTSSDGMYRSSNRGGTWENVNTGLNTSYISDVIYNNTGSPTFLYVATDSGMFKSSDYGEQWVSSNEGMSDLNLRTIYKTNDFMFAAASNKNYRSTDEGESWEEITIGTANQQTRAFVRYEDKIFAGLSNNGNQIYKSTNFGITWEPSDSGSLSEVISMEKLGNKLFAGHHSMLQESTDGGNTWNDPFPGIPAGYPIPELKALGNHLFVASFIGVYFIKTDDSDVTDITGNIPFPSILSIDVNINYIIVGVFNFPENTYEIWTRPTPDVVTEWTSYSILRNSLNKPIQDFETTSDIITVSNGSLAVVDVNVTIDTVFHTNDSDLVFTLSHNSIYDTLIFQAGGTGDNFIGTMLNDDTFEPVVNGSAPFTGIFRPHKPLSIFNGTESDGDWILSVYDGTTGNTGVLDAWSLHLTVSGVTNIKDENQAGNPQRFILHQNFPNPFNPSTIIRFALPNAGYIKLEVFNLLGERVVTLVNSEMNAGFHEVIFDASKLTSGIYIYRIVADRFAETKKMILLR